MQKRQQRKDVPRCDIRLINYLGNAYAFTFDNQGRVLTMTTNGDPVRNANYTYTYTSDSCILIAKKNNRLWTRTSALLNARGLPTSSVTAEFNEHSDSPIPIPYQDSLYMTYEYDNMKRIP